MRHFLLSISLVVGITLGGCQSGTEENNTKSEDSKVLRVWWNEGYYPEETEAIRSTVERWQTETNSEVDLVFYSEKDLVQQTENALAAESPPDVIYGYGIDLLLLPRLAWDGKLADVSSVLEPMQAQYEPAALESVRYYNNKEQKRSYYAVPLSQQITHIHYWQDLLKEAKLDPKNIPQDWKGFWSFWQKGHDNLKQQGVTEIYGIGLPMSVAATDTFTLFQQFLEAYNVEILDGNGNLQLDNPANRQGIIAALQDYTQHYKDGYVPPGATEWADPDNNVTFLSGLTLMTANATMSIPGSQRQDEVNYFDRMRTIAWPKKPDGSPMRYITSTKQLAILSGTDNLEQAQSLVTFLIQPDNLQAYVEGSQGRFFPVVPSIVEKSELWKNPKDPHLSIVPKQFENTRPSYVVLNPAYSEVQAKNIWGKAIYSMGVEGVTAEQATDTAIEEIKVIFAGWKK
jgi:multiple sugar transport system substrate-binding protein